MSARNSVICIAKDIKIDRQYKNTLALSQAQIQSLCQTKATYFGDNYSFIRTENRIKVQAPFSQLFESNYCYIINQGVLQFFFVVDVKYISDATTEIIVEEDVLTTYKHKGFIDAYCERQHPQTDELYANTIEEPVSPSNHKQNGDAYLVNCNPVQLVAVYTEMKNGNTNYEWNEEFHMGTFLSHYYYDMSDAGMLELLDDYNRYYVGPGKGDDLLGVLYVPAIASTTNPIVIELPQPTDIHGYVPKNNKIFNFPYCIVQFTNNTGSTLELKPELFGNRIFHTICMHVGTDAQAFCYPISYMGRPNNYEYGLMITNYPQLPVTKDGFLEWAGATARRLNEGMIGSLVTMGLSIPMAAVTGGFSLAAGAAALGGIVQDLSAAAAHVDDTPDTIRGQAGGDIVSLISQKYKFRIETLALTREQAEVVDDFFTRFGYAQSNRMPINVTNPRFHCHYVKTVAGECVVQGIPQEKADIINAAFNGGITFWDSNENVGNYNLKS